MLEFALNALDQAAQRGVPYADVRAVERRSEHMAVKDGQPGPATTTEDAGYGLRILVDGAWGFAVGREFSAKAAVETLEQALAAARAGALQAGSGLVMPPRAGEQGIYASEVEQDPFALPREERLALLLACHEAMGRYPAVHHTEAHLTLAREHKWFVSSEGDHQEQTIVTCGGGAAATAEAADGSIQRRSFENHAQAGYEFVRALDLPARAARCAEEAVALLSAPACPAGPQTVVLGSGLLARLLYETCGRQVELDRVRAGRSFVTIDQLGLLAYGSPSVTIVADAKLPHGLGSFGWDDEGSPAELFPIVERGLFVSYLTSRPTAWWLTNHYHHTTPVPPLPFSNGSARAGGWQQPPRVQATNLSLEPGDWALADLLADTGDGLFLDTPRSWRVDDRGQRFHVDVEVAREIVGGKLGRLLRGAGISGSTIPFWNSCNAVTVADHWQLWGLPAAAGGEPSPAIPVGLGAAPARFRGIQVSRGE